MTKLNFLIFCLIFSQLPRLHAANIVIDPGHGGKDDGAVRGTLHEADIALSVAMELKELLSKNPNFNVTLTRENDKTLSLHERIQIAEKAQADLLISIHANASEDHRARGAEFYFQNQLAPEQEALFLASRENETAAELPSSNQDKLSKKNDLHMILEDLGRNYRITRSALLAKTLLLNWQDHEHQRQQALQQAPFYLVSKLNIPSVLVELGFISHTQEAQRLADPARQKEMAYQLYQGLLKFKEVLDKDNLPGLNWANAY